MEVSGLRGYLLAIDFSPNEADVYLALLSHGSSPAGPLIATTGFHRNVVYTALEHLRARKLVAESSVRGKKMFSIADPNILVVEAKDRQEAAREAAQAIGRLRGGVPQEITIHTGNDEYLSLLVGLLRVIPKNKTVYVLGTGGGAFMEYTMRPIWKKYHEVAEAQKLTIKMIGYDSQRLDFADDIRGLDYYDVRYLRDNIENPGGVHIYPEVSTVLNIIYSDEHTPVTAVKIRNTGLAKGYLNLFNNLWKMARK